MIDCLRTLLLSFAYFSFVSRLQCKLVHLLKLLEIFCCIEQNIKSEKVPKMYRTYDENGYIVISLMPTGMQTQYLIG